MASERDVDLWLALLYVSGEATPEEAETFECRLDQDQAAREALASAVELVGAFAAQPPAPAVPILPLERVRRRPSLTTIASLAAAAAVAGLLAIPSRESGQVSYQKTVTLAWLTLRQDFEPEPDLVVEAEEPAVVACDEASDQDLPLWLLDAAALARGPDTSATPAKEL